MESQCTDLGLESLGEETSSSASSREHRARGKKYLKSHAAAGGNMTHSNACSREEESNQSLRKSVVVKQQLGLDGEEEMRESMDFSFGCENQRGVASDSKRGVKVHGDFAGLCSFIYTCLKLCPIHKSCLDNTRSKI